ncbi:MAG: hypothetical protein CFE26_02170, partial [Verrucomicrobiales bacterium VVV1]
MANDAFANATVISQGQLPYSTSLSATGTAEPGEPAHAGSPAMASRWLSWTAAQTQPCRFEEFFNSGTARLAVYTGNTLATLTPVAQGLGSIAFLANANTTYHLVVDSPGSDFIRLNPFPPGGADDLSYAEPISGPLPLQVTGNNIVATAAKDDEDWLPSYPPIATVWWSWISDFNGTIRMDARRSNVTARLTLYEKTPAGSLVRVAIGVDIAVLEVTKTTEYLICVDSTEGTGKIEFVLQPVPPDPPSNDDVAKARDLGSGSVICDGEWIHHATAEAGVVNETPGMFGLPGDRTLWWKWTCPASGTYRISQLGSDRASTIFLYTGSPLAGILAATSDLPEGTLLNATSGTKYWIQIRTIAPHAVRTEINIHPATHEPAYFQTLVGRGYFALEGPDRHPAADPDGDGFPNEIEIACGSSPELPDAQNPRLPNLLPHLSGWKLQWQRDENYLTGGSGLPILLRGETST